MTIISPRIRRATVVTPRRSSDTLSSATLAWPDACRAATGRSRRSRATPAKPRLAAPIVRPLFISSLDNYFSVVGRFSGALTVFDDSIVVKFDSLIATRRLPNDQQQIRLDSIRVGIGVGSDTAWSPVDDSKALVIDRELPKGEVIERKDVRFVMQHERRPADDDSWIVVTFHITVNRDGDSDGANAPPPPTRTPGDGCWRPGESKRLNRLHAHRFLAHDRAQLLGQFLPELRPLVILRRRVLEQRDFPFVVLSRRHH